MAAVTQQHRHSSSMARVVVEHRQWLDPERYPALIATYLHVQRRAARRQTRARVWGRVRRLLAGGGG